MTRSQIFLGVVALALVLLGTRAAGPTPAGAQSATPAAGATTTRTVDPDDAADAADRADPHTAMTARVDDFLAKLAANLGTDPAALDAALRTTAKQQIDDRAAAGDLSPKEAETLKARIDAADALPLVGFGPGGDHRGGFGGPGGHDGRGERPDHGAPWGGPGDDRDPRSDRGELPGLPADQPETDSPAVGATPTV